MKQTGMLILTGCVPAVPVPAVPPVREGEAFSVKEWRKTGGADGPVREGEFANEPQRVACVRLRHGRRSNIF